MEQNYTVQFKVHNTESGAWANTISLQTTDEDAAIAKFGEEVGRLWNAKDFDFVGIYKFDLNGNCESKIKDRRTALEPKAE